MTRMKHFPAIWLKCELVIVLLVHRGSPLEKGFSYKLHTHNCLSFSKTYLSVVVTINLLGGNPFSSQASECNSD